MHEDKRSIDYCRNDGGDVLNVARSHATVHPMKIGALVRSIHDYQLHGIVMERGPTETRIDHGDGVVKVLWADGETTYEFLKVLEILSEGR